MKRPKDRQNETPPPARSALVDDAAERLATIVAAAERAAEQVIDDAEKQARALLAEAEAESARVRGELLDVVERLAHELGVDPAAPAPPSRGNHLSAVPLDEPQPARPAGAPLEPAVPDRSGPALGSAAGARLLATQMAVSGSSREEIEAKLRNGFEIEDTDAILDAILGPED
ncbi:MAG TPA: hypothetical protein VHR18_03705 [Solirubrobacterales bacterium]|nr:hypothetical protein [Solirubrobacterales bacterium]